MGDLVEFPSGLILSQGEKARGKDEQDYDVAMDCVDLAVQLFDVLEKTLEESDSPLCQKMNFSDPEAAEARDIYVIINLLSSMLIRYNGVKHTMHPYLDDLYFVLLGNTGDHLDTTWL